MAAAQLKLSRRALLGAACAAPFTAASPSSVRFERSREAAPSAAEALQLEWQQALARYRDAEAAVSALEGDPDEDAFDDALERFNAVLAALLATPAPHVAALAAKLDLAIAAEVHELTYGPPALAALAQDAHRLS